jgi:hypothetical protein
MEVFHLAKMLAVFDSDASYAARLTEFIRRENTEGFEVTLFTRKDTLEEFLIHREIELLLLGEGILPEGLPSGNIKYILGLSDRKVGNQRNDVSLIYKYQSASGVLSDILSCYARLENLRTDSRTGAKPGENRIVSVFTPLNSIMSTTYAWFYAAGLAERRKTLYLPFELFPVPVSEAAQEMDHSLSEFLFYLKEDAPGLLQKLKSLLKYTGKLPYLSGLTHGLDLTSLTKEDAARLVGELRKNSDYDVIVLYLGIYTEFSIELMNRSDSVQIPVQGGDYAGNVIREWERQMDFFGLDTGQTKFIKIDLPTEQPFQIDGISKEQQYYALRQMAAQQAERL